MVWLTEKPNMDLLTVYTEKVTVPWGPPVVFSNCLDMYCLDQAKTIPGKGQVIKYT